MRFALIAALSLAPVLAYADAAPSFEIQDHGESVEIVAHNVEAKSLSFSAVRSRVEIQVTGPAIGALRQVSADPTVFLVEFDGSSRRVLSIKTRLDHNEVVNLANLAKATQVGTDLHVAFPRHAIAEVAKPVEVKAPAPTKIEAPKPEAKPEPKPEPKLETKVEPKPELKPELKPEPKTEIKPEPKVEKTELKPAPKAESTPIPPQPKEGFASSPGVLGIGALLALLGCGYVMKKKKQGATVTSTIDVVAQRALGNKAKVMWLSAGGRELLVSVTQQNVRMLGSWPKSDRQGAEKDLPRATQLERALTNSNLLEKTTSTQTFQQQLTEEIEAPAPQPQSAAVSGILKLRARAGTVQPAINPDVATEDDDADLEWAKEILTASGGRR